MTTLKSEIKKFRKELDRLYTIFMNLMKLRKIPVVDTGYDRRLDSLSESGYYVEVDEDDIDRVISIIRQIGFKKEYESGDNRYFTKDDKGEIVVDAEDGLVYIAKSLIEDFMFPVWQDELEEYFKCKITLEEVSESDQFEKVCENLYSAKYFNSVIYITFYPKEVVFNTRPSEKIMT